MCALLYFFFFRTALLASDLAPWNVIPCCQNSVSQPVAPQIGHPALWSGSKGDASFLSDTAHLHTRDIHRSRQRLLLSLGSDNLSWDYPLQLRHSRHERIRLAPSSALVRIRRCNPRSGTGNDHPLPRDAPGTHADILGRQRTVRILVPKTCC
jgi:hypothetical protein